MKKVFYLIIVFLISLFVTACTPGINPESSSSGGSSKERSIPQLPHTSSDWLFVMYMDADNNLNDELWLDITNVQLAQNSLLQNINTPKQGYPSVKVVMLWNGENQQDADSLRNTRLHPRGEIYELGPMDSDTANLITDRNNAGEFLNTYWMLSRYSKRLTDYAPWLSYEPDMGDVSTLSNFLSWVNTNYSADNIVLCLSDHGSGTEYENISGGIINSPALRNSRSLCSDDTNSTSKLLTATDVKNAINDSGLHPNIIWMDCCLQGNVETAYILKGCADYLVTSANVSYSNSHYNIISSLTSRNIDPQELGRTIVKCYAEKYKYDIKSVDDDDDRTSYDVVLTQAQYDLSEQKQMTLFNKINLLAMAIQRESDETKMAIYNNFLKQDRTNINNCKGMTYGGTYTVLSDIGYLCRQICDSTTLGISDNTKNAANEVMNSLNDIIITSWIGTKTQLVTNPEPSSVRLVYTKNLSDLSYNNTNELLTTDGSFGLTIVSHSFIHDSGYFQDPIQTHVYEIAFPIYENYSNVTGYAHEWGNLLSFWHRN